MKLNVHKIVFLVCAGSLGEITVVAHLAHNLLKKPEVLKSQLDLMIARRAKLLLPTKTAAYYRCLVYEMLYLWNSLPPSAGLLTILKGIYVHGSIT